MRHTQRLLLLSTLLFSGASPLASPSLQGVQPSFKADATPSTTTRLITVPPRHPSAPQGGYQF